jgi:hypothetical protein
MAKKKPTKSVEVSISDPSANPENPEQDPKIPTSTKEGRLKKVEPGPNDQSTGLIRRRRRRRR